METLWLTIYPYKLPREVSCITVGVIYHPPNSNNTELYNHISHCLDHILQVHPDSGVLLVGDFNHFKDASIKQSFKLVQLVKKPTRGDNILDKILTNMDKFYATPQILPPLGASDHFVVTCHPNIQHTYKKQNMHILKRSTDANGKNMFVHAIKSIDWSELYRAD